MPDVPDLTEIDDATYERLSAEAAAGCCMDDTWRGHACGFHQGFADGLEAGWRAFGQRLNGLHTVDDAGS